MTSTTRLLFLVSAIVAGLFLTGCGKGGCPTTNLTSSGGTASGGISTGGTVCGAGNGGGGNGTAAAFMFYIDPFANTVGTASLSTSGTFSVLSGLTPPATAGAITDDMTVVNKQFVYIPFGDINGVQGLAINSTTGALTPIAGSPFLLPGGTADSIIADPKGKFLFVGSEGIGAISVFTIGATGALTQVSGSPFTSFNLLSADSLAVDGTGSFLYVGQLNPAVPLDEFSIDSNTGALSEVGPYNLGVAQLHADSSGKYLLGVKEIADNPLSATDAHISVFSIDPTTGAPTPVAGSPFVTTAPPYDFVISPNAQFVYVLESSGASFAPLEGFQLNSSSGALSSISGSPFTTLAIPNYCKFDQSGGEIFCDTGAGFAVLTANATTGALTSTVPNLTNISYFTFAWAISD